MLILILNNFFMKLNKKGFSLIELMVVIAIIWILATAGISMYGTYQAKARDTKRVSNLNSLTIWLQGYYTDKSEYPDPQTTNCLSTDKWILSDSLAPYYDNKAIPLDPQKNRVAWGCTTAWAPFYTPIKKDKVAKAAYVLWSNVEVKSTANYYYNTIDSSDNAYSVESAKINAITDAQRKVSTSNPAEKILYAIVNN